MSDKNKKSSPKISMILAFVLTIAIMVALLVISAVIPKDAIKPNMQKSAEYLAQRELYPLMVDGVDGSRIDVYADSILLNIIYSYDSSDPLTSVAKSAYFFKEDQDENLNLLEAVTKDTQPNQQYLRYWHGSSVIIRPLLTVLSLPQIYAFNAVVMIILYVWFAVHAHRSGNTLLAVGMVIALIMTRIWFVPLCLEYTWIFLILPVASYFALRLSGRKSDKLPLLFMIVGMVTNYLDFLTCETLTLLIPLMITIYVAVQNRESIGETVKTSVKASASWLLGYALTWIAKWAFAALILHENVMPYVSGHISERIGRDLGISTFRYLTGAVFYNFTCLFPLRHSFWSMIGFAIIVIAFFYFGYVYKRPGA
ncbi:MAG: hypothetical protein K6F87_06450, partial [Lachnospiraceae bacterium]|nr:hypothetical protein [Lachnospiraceae bacterium]